MLCKINEFKTIGFSGKTLSKKYENKPFEDKNNPKETGIQNLNYSPLHPSFLGKKPEISRSTILNFIDSEEPFTKSGLKGDVYKMSHGGKTYAIKVSKSKGEDTEDFSKEAEVLKRTPKGTGQEFVDYFKDPKTYACVLVSTFVAGESTYFKEKQDFNTLFDTLFKLDKAGILHGDLNMGNCLLDGEKINLIDFGEGSLFSTGEGYDEMYPPFMIKTNAINLEQNGIPDCILGWKNSGIEANSAFKNYLQAKGEFYKKHAEFLINSGVQNLDAVDYEDNLSKVLSSPTERIIENEIRRMDALYTFEQADTEVNYSKNPNGAKTNWGLTLKKTREMLDKINKNLESENLSPDERKYFIYQKQIAETMLENFTDWSTGTIHWIESCFTRPKEDLSSHEAAFIENKDKEAPLPPNLYSIIISY